MKRKLLVIYLVWTLFSILATSSVEGAVVYFYDSLNRITSADYGTGLVIGYTYDAAGNRKSQVISSSAPKIAAQPQSQTTALNGAATFSVSASGAGTLRYQWKLNGVSLVNGPNVSGATSSTLKLTNVGPAQVGSYTVTVSNGAPVTSKPAILTVLKTSALFVDDFNDNSIDFNKWTKSGKMVVEKGKVMKVLTTVADHSGSLTSKPITINRNGLITISRRVFLHHDDSRTFKGKKHFFSGKFQITIGTLPTFGVDYESYDGKSSGDLPKHGFYITRKNATAHNLRQQRNVSAKVAAVWDKWFNEKIIYDPSSGVLMYYINDVKKITFNVGKLPESSPAKMELFFQADGRWAGHQQKFDGMLVTQASPVPQMRVVDPYQQWASGKFGTSVGNDLVAGHQADPDRDGISNWMEYALGLNPLQSSSWGLPKSKVEKIGGDSFLEFTYRHLLIPSGLNYTVGVSDNLQTWDWTESQLDPLKTHAPVGDGLTEEVTVRLATPVNRLPTSKYLRLKVSDSP